MGTTICGAATVGQWPIFSELSPQVLAAPGVASAGRHTKTKARVWAAVTPVSGVPVDGGGACVPCRRGSGTFPQSRRDIQWSGKVPRGVYAMVDCSQTMVHPTVIWSGIAEGRLNGGLVYNTHNNTIVPLEIKYKGLMLPLTSAWHIASFWEQIAQRYWGNVWGCIHDC